MLYLTNKRITMVILVLLIVIPLLSAFFWYDLSYSYVYDLEYLVEMNAVSPALAKEFVQQQLA